MGEMKYGAARSRSWREPGETGLWTDTAHHGLIVRGGERCSGGAGGGRVIFLLLLLLLLFCILAVSLCNW